MAVALPRIQKQVTRLKMILRKQNPKVSLSDRPVRSPLRAAIGAVCIFLILLVGAAHLLHVHPADAPPDTTCSLCIVAHLAASPAPAVAGSAIEAVLRSMPPPPAALPATSATLHAFYIRPPPSR